MIFGNARAEEPAERVCFVGRSNGGGARGDWPGGLQRGESREFVGGGGHLGTQPVEDGKGGLFCARGDIALRVDSGRAALFAGTGRAVFARFWQVELVRGIETLRKAG